MRRRSGFTLVEVMVSMALILFIMSILAAAFAAATQAVSDLKSAGDLAEKLRGANNVLRRDLAGNHFTSDGFQNAGQMLSTLWAGQTTPAPPPYGFFRIFEGTAAQDEGGEVDPAAPHSFYQTKAALHYTVATIGTGEWQRKDFYSGFVPPGSPLLTAPVLAPADARYQDTQGVYNSPVAEVAVFMVATGDSTDPSTGPSLPLFALYRRQMTTIPINLNNPTTNTGYSQFAVPANTANQSVDTSGNNLYLETSTNTRGPDSSVPPNLYFNGPDDLTMPFRRLGMDPSSMAGVFPAGSAHYPRMVDENTNPGNANPAPENTTFKSADLLLTDVVSFDVRVLLQGGSDFVDLFDPTVQAFSNNNPAFTAAGGPRVFDTWSSQGTYSTWQTPGALTSIPLFQNGGQSISIQAIQITLRVWDFKTKKTRQVTMIQKM